jgi:hypothetical protein
VIATGVEALPRIEQRGLQFTILKTRSSLITQHSLAFSGLLRSYERRAVTSKLAMVRMETGTTSFGGFGSKDSQLLARALITMVEEPAAESK